VINERTTGKAENIMLSPTLSGAEGNKVLGISKFKILKVQLVV